MEQENQFRWRPSRRQLLWAGSIAALAFVIIVICGYLFGWKWTGLPKQTLWDWLDLLIVPVVLAIGGYLFTGSENQRTQQNAEKQRELDREIATQRTEEDRNIAERRTQDDALQAYLDQVGQLLLDKDKPLRQSKEGDEVRTLARARTLTVLQRMNRERKEVVVRFLIESGLVQQEHAEQDKPALDIPREASIVRFLRKVIPRQQEPPKEEEHIVDRQPIISLSGVTLGDIDLSAANLVGADLSGADLRKANLSNADMSGANLSNADLRGAYAEPRGTLTSVDFSEANLDKADLQDADFSLAIMTRTGLHQTILRNTTLIGVDLTGAWLTRADLRDANLIDAKLTGAHLYSAKLRNAHLLGADLSGASLNGAEGWTAEQLAQATLLEGPMTIMPDGQALKNDWNPDRPTFEEWLKSKGTKEDGEATGHS